MSNQLNFCMITATLIGVYSMVHAMKNNGTIAKPDELLDTTRMEARLEAGEPPIKVYREHLQAADDALDFHFLAGMDAGRLTHRRAQVMDRLLTTIWSRGGWRDDEPLALLAVGGYGRAELHPGSDVDLMILLRDDDDSPYRDRLTSFIQLLWDIKLKLGSSVRSLSECKAEAIKDVTVATNIMETRMLAGDASLFADMNRLCNSDEVWPGPRFFEAKLAEQHKRHHRYGNTAYKLEPNIKEGPGGLRDIQMIGWVAKRHFGSSDLSGLVDKGFLTADEFDTLDRGQRFLWRVRWGLHRLAGRPEERLGFDYQRRLAKEFGYQDDDKHLAVEKFMRHYYCIIMELSRLNEMLLQLFRENLLEAAHPVEIMPINRRFRARNGFLEVVHPQVFDESPSALLELFLILAQNHDLKGVRATTIRLIRDHIPLIDDYFRKDLSNITLFMELMRQPWGITHQLRNMNRYGVLAAYIPAFEGIVGQAQFDLFHAYTVDEHTLFVVRNLRRLFVHKYSHELPGCSQIAQSLPKPELLYLAGLFHDIGKGRGGDHSKLGAVDALDFCNRHRLSSFDGHLVAWLIRNHLSFSAVAQRQDISDPEVINRFAEQMGDALHLKYLYLLTVADVRGTSPDMWNSWKAALFHDLYQKTLRALRRGRERPIEKLERIAEVKANAQDLLAMHRIPSQEVDDLWRHMPQEYFLRFTPDEVAWHTRAIHGLDHGQRLLVSVRQRTQRGGTEVFIYTEARKGLFVVVTSLLERVGLSVHDARIITTQYGCTLDSFIVLDESGGPISSSERLDEISDLLNVALQPDTPPAAPPTHHKPSLRARAFNIPTRVEFRKERDGKRTLMEVVTADRPGLLARIGHVLFAAGVSIHDAKIATFGAQVDDLFVIDNQQDQPLSESEQEQLRTALITQLDPAPEPPENKTRKA